MSTLRYMIAMSRLGYTLQDVPIKVHAATSLLISHLTSRVAYLLNT